MPGNVIQFHKGLSDAAFERLLRARLALQEHEFEVISIADVGTAEERSQRGDLVPAASAVAMTTSSSASVGTVRSIGAGTTRAASAA